MADVAILSSSPSLRDKIIIKSQKNKRKTLSKQKPAKAGNSRRRKELSHRPGDPEEGQEREPASKRTSRLAAWQNNLALDKDRDLVFYLHSAVRQEISNETDHITGKTKAISNIPIQLSIYSPHEGQSETIVQDIENMVRSYIVKATDSTEALEVSQEDEITILHVGRQSTHCWIVEAIEIDGPWQ
ncbi:hypothetical protein Fmac_008569 [Flemingia macrophylla]|uniref:Uncharacterized protein n=1 Tax=Flemingia macrophylla TaxID=520843 RepID=A0ABD1MXU4_9FABA